MAKYIAYYRVSTQGQSKSGLGLDAQESAVIAHIKSAALVAHYTDIESGKNSNRPQLLAAIQHAKEVGATLLIAKLDRLSRNMLFISTLMEAGVKFKCCDMPEADNFTIHIFAALAEKERDMISKRTKDALQARKDRGYKLGNVANLTDVGRTIAHKALKEKADSNENNKKAKYVISMHPDKTLRQIADELNNNGFRTSEGGAFTPTQVARLRNR